MAICKAMPYEPFFSPIIPNAFIPKSLYDKLFFTNPPLCNILLKKPCSNSYGKHEFYLMPFEKIENRNNGIFYESHEISIPNYFYNKLSKEKKDMDNLIVRTDIFNIVFKIMDFPSFLWVF